VAGSERCGQEGEMRGGALEASDRTRATEGRTGNSPWDLPEQKRTALEKCFTKDSADGSNEE